MLANTKRLDDKKKERIIVDINLKIQEEKHSKVQANIRV